jgi:recombination protein RecA
LDVGVALGIITKSGTYFSLDGDRLGQGRDNARGFIKARPAVAAELARRIKTATAGVGAIPVVVGAEEDDDGDGTDSSDLSLVV